MTSLAIRDQPDLITEASVCALNSGTVWLRLTDDSWLNSLEKCEFSFVESEPPPQIRNLIQMAFML